MLRCSTSAPSSSGSVARSAAAAALGDRRRCQLRPCPSQPRRRRCGWPAADGLRDRDRLGARCRSRAFALIRDGLRRLIKTDATGPLRDARRRARRLRGGGEELCRRLARERHPTSTLTIRRPRRSSRRRPRPTRCSPNPEQRQAYDRFGHDGLRSAAFRPAARASARSRTLLGGLRGRLGFEVRRGPMASRTSCTRSRSRPTGDLGASVKIPSHEGDARSSCHPGSSTTSSPCAATACQALTAARLATFASPSTSSSPPTSPRARELAEKLEETSKPATCAPNR